MNTETMRCNDFHVLSFPDIPHHSCFQDGARVARESSAWERDSTSLKNIFQPFFSTLLSKYTPR